jgi:ABC-type spermidine/putrescine transport system permease subunit II
MVKRGVTPDVNALSTILLLSTLLVLTGSQFLLRPESRRRDGR